MPTTKEQKRSAFALKRINDFGTKVSKDDANFIVGTPTMILTNGIAQTMAFLLSKKDEKKEVKEVKVFKILQQWLSTEIPALNGTDEKTFLKQFSTLDQNDYLRAQKEALALLQWLKRYARAFQQEVNQ